MISLALGLSLGLRSAPPTAPPIGTESLVSYGRTAGYDAGTTGDVFVDGVNGLDTNNGLTAATAVKTLAKGWTLVSAMSGNRTMRLMGDGVRYREKLVTQYVGSPSSVKIASYGTDMPWISGANVLTGFVQCGAGDEAILGSNYASIYKATVATSTIEHTEYWGCMLSENGTALDLAQLRHNASIPLFFLGAPNTMWHNTTTDPTYDPTLSFTVNPTYYATISHPAVLGAYTDAQLEQAVAAMHAVPNVTGYVPVASVSGGVLTLAANSYRPNGTAGGYALLNVAGAIEQGGWAYRNNGDGTLTFYVWPNNPASLVGGIEIAARKDCIRVGMGAGAFPMTIDGVGLEMCAHGSTDYVAGPLFLNGAHGVTVKQVHIDRYHGGQFIFAKFANDITLDHVTLSWGQGAFGIATGDFNDTGISGHRWSNLLIHDIEQTSLRIYGLRNSCVSDVLVKRTSAGGHANLVSAYTGSDTLAIIRFTASAAPGEVPYAGYGVAQGSSRVLFLHCTFSMADDGRAFVDQNGPLLPPTPSTNTYPQQLINCWVPHDRVKIPDSLTSGAVGVTAGSSMNWEIYNCVSPKITNTGAGTVTRRNNLLTWSLATTADASEAKADFSAVYQDADARNWRAKTGSALGSAMMAGRNVESLIAEWEALFPDVNFRLDALGRAWNPADPGIGPFGKAWGWTP